MGEALKWYIKRIDEEYEKSVIECSKKPPETRDPVADKTGQNSETNTKDNLKNDQQRWSYILDI